MDERAAQPFGADDPIEVGSLHQPVAERAPLPMPTFLVVGHRAVLGSILIFYFFIVFCAARGLIGGWGLPLRVLVPAIGATIVMAAFVVWLAPLLELPEMWYRHHLPARRIARGQCPECGYARPRDQVAEPSSERVCPECGAPREPPPPWQLDWSTFRRFLLLLLTTIVIGTGLGAWWLRQDEQAFVREVRPPRATTYERSRIWPAEFARLRYDEELGFTSTTVLESEPIVGWKPRETP